MKKTYKLNLCSLLLMAVCLMSISSSGHTSTFTMPVSAVTAGVPFMSSTYTINNPQMTVNPTSLNGFTYDYGAGPSTAQTFTVSGSNLSQNVTVYAPTGFQVSTLQGGGYYSSSLTLTPNSGNLTATVHVRMAAGLPVGDHSGSVTVHGGAGLTATVSLSGYVSQYLVVATPTFTPIGGIYNAAQSVAISCATPGATIRYTTNGTDPTTSSPAYSAPLNINQTTTVRAKAWKAGYQPSEVASATYTFNNLSPVLTVDPASLVGFTYVYGSGPSTAQAFTVSGSNLPQSVIVTAPTGFEVSITQGSGYSSSLALSPTSGNLTATVYVRMAAGLPTGVYSGSVTVSCGSDLPATVSLSGSVSSQPTLDVNTDLLEAFAYVFGNGPSENQTVTVSGANLTGVVTVAASSDYEVCGTATGNFSQSVSLNPNGGALNATVYVRMKAGLAQGWHSGSLTIFSSGLENITVALSGSVSPQPVVATPTFTPAGGAYNAAQNVTISCATSGATIRYTTDGTAPTESSPAYSAPLNINQTTTVKAKAWKAGYQPSEVATANYTITYTITTTASPSNGGTVSSGGQYSYGQSCTVVATAATGYSFLNWTENGSTVSTNASYTFTVTGNRTLVAHFSQAQYNIIVSASPQEGGTITGGGGYNHGQPCTLVATANPGYTFQKWTENGTQISTNPTLTFNVTGSRTLVAHFQLQSYTITATANPSNGGTVSGGGTYPHGQTCTLHAVPNSGYTFVKWTKNGSQVSTNPDYSFTVTGSASYVAHFQAQSYTITATANPSNGGTVSGGGQYTYNQTCILQAVPNNGYTFVKWTKNGTQVSTNASYTFAVTESASYVAHFQLQSYTITVSANPSNGGTVSGGGTYTHGQNCTVVATASTGYTFVRWTENGQQVSDNASYTFTVTGNRTLIAQFQAQSYTITTTANPSNGGTVSGGGSYTYGQNCTVVAAASTGYTFQRWTENGQSVSNNASYTFTVTGNRTLVAQFQLQSYTITATANPGNGGTVSGGGQYTYGQPCTVIATANSGYTFLRWTENGQTVSTNANYSFTVTGDRTLVAQFQAQSYTITATANPSNGGIVTGGGLYIHGQSCTLVATASAGYNFVRWTKNGQQVSTYPNYTFTVTGSAAYVAHFTQQSCTISVSANPTDGGSVSGGGQYNYGQPCTVHAEANTGYTFVNWTENGSQVSANADYTFTVTGSRNLVAHFTHQEFVITAEADPEDGGTVGGSGGYDYGDGCTLTATPATGYDFKNWTKDGQVVGTDPSISFTVTESATYVAHFQKQSFTIAVTADPTDGGDISGGGTYEYGERCTLRATPNEGYAFTNWTEDGTDISSHAEYEFIVTEDRTFVAHFQIQQYLIKANAEPAEGGTVEGVGGYNYGEECTLTATPATGYEFKNWTKDGQEVGTEPSISFTVTESATYVAHFRKQSFAIAVTADPTDGGDISGAGTYEYGELCTLQAHPNAGYTFTHWTEDGTSISSDPEYEFLVTEDRTLVAQFTQNVSGFTISVSVNLTDGGTVTGAGNYTSGLTCILTATANDGYQFVNWTENGVIQWLTEQYRFVVDRDRTLVANFEALPTFTILAMSGPNGSITPVGDVKVVKGSNQTFTMTPDTGCRIVTVLADGIDIGPVETYTFTNINRDHTIYVLFSGMGVEEERILNVNVYPNPAKDIVYVEGEGIQTMILYDMLGNCLRTIDYNTSKELNVSGLPKGAYVLKLMTQDGRMGYQKLVLN